jgi:hypothetical protein
MYNAIPATAKLFFQNVKLPKFQKVFGRAGTSRASNE